MAKNFEVNRGNNNCISLSGIAYVVIPEDADVADYVQRCYRNHTLSISGGFGATAMHNVKTTENVLNQVKFPNGDKAGSAVVWIRESFTNRPIIIGVLKDGGQSDLTSPGQQRIFQQMAEKLAEIFLDASNSQVIINSAGDNENTSSVIIKSKSGRKSSGDKIDLISGDEINNESKNYNIFASESFTLNVENSDGVQLVVYGDGLEYRIYDVRNGNQILLDADGVSIRDNNGNEFIQNETNTQIKCFEFNVGTGNEQMVLGNTLVDLLGELIDAILNLTVLTHAGPSGTCVNADAFAKIKAKLETILSKISNTD